MPETILTLDEVERAAIEGALQKAHEAAAEARAASAAAKRIARTVALRHGHDLPEKVSVRVVAKKDGSGLEALAFEPAPVAEG